MGVFKIVLSFCTWMCLVSSVIFASYAPYIEILGLTGPRQFYMTCWGGVQGEKPSWFSLSSRFWLIRHFSPIFSVIFLPFSQIFCHFFLLRGRVNFAPLSKVQTPEKPLPYHCMWGGGLFFSIWTTSGMRSYERMRGTTTRWKIRRSYFTPTPS